MLYYVNTPDTEGQILYDSIYMKYKLIETQNRCYQVLERGKKREFLFNGSRV